MSIGLLPHACVEVREQFAGAGFSFYLVGPRDQTQVVRVDIKSPCPLNYLADFLVLFFF